VHKQSHAKVKANKNIYKRCRSFSLISTALIPKIKKLSNDTRLMWQENCRNRISEEQHQVLEDRFTSNQSPGPEERLELAVGLNIPPKAIQVW
jgi:hypothetical protein